jgi:hypothetical protein
MEMGTTQMGHHLSGSKGGVSDASVSRDFRSILRNFGDRAYSLRHNPGRTQLGLLSFGNRKTDSPSDTGTNGLIS